MKVAIFTETYLPDINGVATHIKTLKDGLEKLGHEVLVVKPDASIRQMRLENGILSCPAVHLKKIYNYNLSSPVSMRRMSLIRQWDPDVIHIQNEFGMGLFGLSAAKLLKKPLVYTLHTMYDDYLYYIAPPKLIPAAKKSIHRYGRFLANKSDAVIGASPKIRQFFEECGVEKQVRVIPNAVELDIFSRERIPEEKILEARQALGLEEGDTAACFCGRIAQEKNLDTLLDYWKETIQQNDRLKLAVIGEGPDLDALKEKTRSLGLDSMIRFMGKVPHSSLPAYYAACDCYLTASLSENYSISILEAMAAGLPVVHLRDEVNEYQYQEGVSGQVFDTAQEMGEILKAVRDLSPEEMLQRKQAVRDSVRYSGAESMASSVLNIYDSVCEARMVIDPSRLALRYRFRR